MNVKTNRRDFLTTLTSGVGSMTMATTLTSSIHFQKLYSKDSNDTSNLSKDLDSSPNTQRPNFLIILTDDQKLNTIGVYNKKCPIKTPAMDKLAQEGMRFDNGFATTPICAVSRASILTGRYASSHQLHQFNTPLSANSFKYSYPVLLKNAGYFSGHFGKYGVGYTEDQQAQFDRFEGQSQQGPKFRMYKGKKLHDAEWLSVKAEEFLEQVPGAKPFVLQLSYKEPHSSSAVAPEDDELLEKVDFDRDPQDTPEAFAKLPEIAKLSIMKRVYDKNFNIDGNINHYMRSYFEKIVSLDRSIARVRKALKKNGQAENTVILFLSDHGTHFGEKQLAGKWTPYEQSLRIPFFLYDPRPGSLKGQVSEKTVLNIDIAPTLMDMAGLGIPKVMDGRSLAPLMKGDKVKWRESFGFEHFTAPSPIAWPIPRNDGIRTDKFKYARWIDTKPLVEELFDLEIDPGETTNLVRNKIKPIKKTSIKCESYIRNGERKLPRHIM